MANKSLDAHLFECLKEGNTKKALYIINLLGDKVNNLYRGKSPLLWAKEFENDEVARVLEEKGAVEKAISEEEAYKLGLELVKKAKVGDLDAVKTLIENGAKVDEKDEDSYTALITASQCGHVKIVKTLIENGAKVDEKDIYGDTALIKASKEGHVEVVKALIENGAKVDEKDEDGDTPLMWASTYDHVEVVKALIENGAKVDEKDNDGDTALMWASRYDYVKIAKALLDAGADVTITNNKGYTAIDYTGNDGIKKMINEALRKQKVQKFKNKISDFFGR